MEEDLASESDLRQYSDSGEHECLDLLLKQLAQRNNFQNYVVYTVEGLPNDKELGSSVKTLDLEMIGRLPLIQ